MSRCRGLSGLVIVGVAGLFAAGVVEAATPSGIEFQIHTYTAGAQRAPAAAIGADGEFVVVWHSIGQDGDDAGIFAQRFDSSGARQGGEFQVNTYTPNYQGNPRVAMAAAGGFVVVWASGQDGSGAGVFGARFDSSGTALGAEFQVNSYTVDYQRSSTLAAQGDGSFIVAWRSENQDGQGPGVFAARFDASATRLGDEFQVNVYTTGAQVVTSVDVDGAGRFVVVWQSGGQDGDGIGVFARRFDGSGLPLGLEFQVNVYTINWQQQAKVAGRSDGDFVIAWTSADGDSNGIFARRFDEAGAPQGADLQVNSYISGSQAGSEIGIDAAGGFAVAWQDSGRDGSGDGVFARRLDSAGGAETSEFQVNTYTISSQNGTALAMAGDGGFLVAWQSSAQDGDSDGIFGQLFRGFSGYDVDGDGAIEPLTDGLLMVRYFFGFRGAALTTGAVGAGCTRCDAASIEAFIEARL